MAFKFSLVQILDIKLVGLIRVLKSQYYVLVILANIHQSVHQIPFSKRLVTPM